MGFNFFLNISLRLNGFQLFFNISNTDVKCLHLWRVKYKKMMPHSPRAKLLSCLVLWHVAVTKRALRGIFATNCSDEADTTRAGSRGVFMQQHS